MRNSLGPTEVGRATERWAERQLEDAGYRIVTRNYRCKVGEIDLIAHDGETLVFVEVRGRRRVTHGTPEETIDHRKRLRLWRAAERYLQELRTPPPPCRFDVVAVEGSPDRPVQTRIVRDAFRGGDI